MSAPCGSNREEYAHAGTMWMMQDRGADVCVRLAAAHHAHPKAPPAPWQRSSEGACAHAVGLGGLEVLVYE